MRARTKANFRVPTDDELILLTHAVHAPTRGTKTYQRQLNGIRVRYDCKCGCPSIGLQVRPGAATAKAAYEVADVGYAQYDDVSDLCWVILFIRDGKLSELELAPMNETPSPRAKLVRLESPGRDILYSAAEVN